MRKASLLGFLTVVSIVAYAQTGNVFHLDKLSKNDTLLSGWVFHPGDNSLWSNTDFNDSKWHQVDPSTDVTDFTQLKEAGTGWFRLHIKVDSNIAKQKLTAWILQYTASEIYLNGKLIRKYGTIAADPYKTRALCPSQELIDLNLRPGADQVLAVRVGYQAGIPYISPFFTPLSAFNIYVNTAGDAFNNYQQNARFITNGSIFIGSGAGLFLIISIIYLAYFISDRLQKVNLYYFLFSVSILVSLAFFVEFVGNVESITAQMTMDVFVSITFETGFLCMLLTIYALFDYRPRTVFKALIFIAGAFFCCQFYKGTLGFILCSNVFLILCFIEGGRVAILAIKSKKDGAVIILCGMLLSIIFQIWSAVIDQATLLSLVLAVLSFAGFPLVMAIFLGIQYAFTNQQLRRSLVEVEELSQQKQQILADQNILLEEQVAERIAELSRSLIELKSAQNQLVQKEKMASLGELTAGIAHEIQNPLNFVNNFSEVSVELIEELGEELNKGDIEEAKTIANDVKQNLEKIYHHGKRADSIVKGMLEHSRASTGQKELTDLNLLANEYLRLAYHGMRSKDKSFHAELVTHFDGKLPKLSVISQDMGRVLLNLFNNAFYAVDQKKKTAGSNYKPTVTITTFAPSSRGWGVSVKDNGDGIPDAIKDKIMQPFFTTKPTGEGTGLGLSLSYDIVVKGHGGSIEVNSKEGEGSEFIIQLPI